jgi:hypothetical protein
MYGFGFHEYFQHSSPPPFAITLSLKHVSTPFFIHYLLESTHFSVSSNNGFTSDLLPKVRSTSELSNQPQMATAMFAKMENLQKSVVHF